MTTRIGVLVSGGGSDMQVLINQLSDSSFCDAEIVTVISNRPGVGALYKASAAHIHSMWMNPELYSSREVYDEMLVAHFRALGVDLILCMGWKRILSPVFTKAFAGRIMNLHPALLPAFQGFDPQKQALEYGVSVTGCTVHFVDEGVDTGPIILQAVVPVFWSDTEEVLSKRIQQKAWQVYPEAVRLFSTGRLTIIGRKVYIDDKEEILI